MPSIRSRVRRFTNTARVATQAAADLATAGGADRGTQLLLRRGYQSDLAAGKLPALSDVEFRNYSQNGEDGILLFLLSIIGMGTRRAVELCAGDGIECNCANLILHHGWDALLVDGNADLVARGRRFYASHPETRRIGPILAHEWITAEDVNVLLSSHGFDSSLDVLSLDLDGMDYWILKALTVKPRIIVCEYNNRIPSGEAVTVPYDPEFAARDGEIHEDGFFGASLDAFVRLLKGRSYRLIGANRENTNAFFLRQDVGEHIPEARASDWLMSRWARHQQQSWEMLRRRPWVRV